MRQGAPGGLSRQIVQPGGTMLDAFGYSGVYNDDVAHLWFVLGQARIRGTVQMIINPVAMWCTPACVRGMRITLVLVASLATRTQSGPWSRLARVCAHCSGIRVNSLPASTPSTEAALPVLMASRSWPSGRTTATHWPAGTLA